MCRLGALCTILFFVFLDLGSSKDDCPPSRCSLDGPEIRFPFRRSDYPDHCGYPGFELACQGNDAVIKLPTFRDFPITNISYATQTLTLESKFCPASVILNLDVSNSPFRFYNYGLVDERENYTLLNCSTANSIAATDSRYNYTEDYYEIQCTSESDNHIFAIPSSSNLAEIPKFCTSMKTIQGIWPYTNYLGYYSSTNVALKWESPDCASCETGRGTCRRKNSNSLEIMCLPQPQGNHHGGLYVIYWIF